MAEQITQVLGIVGIKHCGAYDATIQYEKLNVVTYNGSSYCAKGNTLGNLPTNTTYWDLMAEKGDKGDTGDTGATGYTPVKGVDYYTAADIAELESTLSSDVSDEVTDQLSTLTSATPLAASSTADMTDTTRIYVNTTDGHWYWYDGDSWEDGGLYQASVNGELEDLIGKKINPNFRVGTFEQAKTSATRAADVTFYEFPKGTVIYIDENNAGNYQLCLFSYDNDFKENGFDYETSSWGNKFIIEKDGVYRLLARKSTNASFNSATFLNDNVKINLPNEDIELENIYVNLVEGYHNRTTNNFVFPFATTYNDMLSSDRFFELNGEKLSILSKTSIFAILLDESLDILTDTIEISGDYAQKISLDMSSYPTAKYVRIVANKGLNTLTKIVSGVKSKNVSSNVVLAAYNSSDINKENAEFVCSGEDDRWILQHALWLSYLRNSNVVLAEGDYILNSFSTIDDGATEKTCLYFNKVKNAYQYANDVKMFSLQGLTQGISFTSGSRIILGDDLYDSINDEVVDLIRGEYQNTYDVTEGVSAISLKNITFVLPMNDKKITCVDLGYSHACDLYDVKCIAVKPEDGYGHLNPPPIANSNCYGIRGLFGSNWNVINTYKNIEVFGFYIGFDISGEHCLVENASAKYNYYGFTFCHLQRYG